MAWELDPDFALQSRITYGRSGTYMWTLACVAALASLVFFRTPTTAKILLVPGLFLLFIALPYSAVQVLALERDGRFDQHRLAGRPPLALGLAVLAGSSWPLWLTAATLIFCAIRMDSGVRVDLPLLVSLGITLALLMLAMPRGRIETWLLRAAILMAAAIVVFLNQAELDSPRPLPRYSRMILVAAAVTSACAFPWVMRRMYRPARQAKMPSTILRPWLNLTHTRAPEFVRTLLGSGDGAAGALVLSIAAATLPAWPIARDATVRENLALLLLYGPVLLAAYNCSTGGARERHTGSLDRVRLAGRPWRVALQLGAGYSLPYLAITATVAVTLIALRWDVTYLLWPLLPVAALLVGVGLVEGFRGRPVGLYIVAALLCLSATDAVENAVVYSGFWIAWICAAASLRRADDAPLKGAAAVIAAAYVGVLAIQLAWHMTHPFLVVAGFAALPLGLFVPDGKPGGGAGHRSLCVLAVGVAAGVMEYAALSTTGGWSVTSSWPHWRLFPAAPALKLVFAITGGLYAAAGFLTGWLVHNLFGGNPTRSRRLRSIPLLFGLAAVPNIFAVPGLESFAWKLSRAIDWSRFFVMDLLVLAALSLIVVALLAIEWRRDCGNAPVTTAWSKVLYR